MHGTVTIERLNGALIFNSADDMLAAMFGAPQHDHHVKVREHHTHLQSQLAAYDRANDAVAAHVREMIARDRARRFA